MQQYGYKISGMARGEKYLEAEQFLDKKLKDYEKGQSTFEEDGSRVQQYTKTAPDGTESVITLVKNVTESGVLVFSDVPLKYFRFGGWVLYLRDILPSFLYSGSFWLILNGFLFRRFYSDIERVIIAFVGAVILSIICRLTDSLLDKNRSFVRRKFIQLGGVFIIPLIFYLFIRSVMVINVSAFLHTLFSTPLPLCIFTMVAFIGSSDRKGGR